MVLVSLQFSVREEDLGENDGEKGGDDHEGDEQDEEDLVRIDSNCIWY